MGVQSARRDQLPDASRRQAEAFRGFGR
jgi:hypothetical protein